MTETNETASPEAEVETPNTENQEAEKVETKAEPEHKPEKEPWFVKRIAELTRSNEDRGRVLAQAERKLRELQPLPAGAGSNAAAPDVNQQAETRAQQIVAERAFNLACNAAHEAGVKAYPDFQASMASLGQAGGLPNTLIEAALETGDAARVLYQLGKDPEKAMAIRDMSPARMGVALAKLAAQDTPVVSVSKAPAPVRSIGGGAVKANDDPEKMSMKEYAAWREKTARTH